MHPFSTTRLVLGLLFLGVSGLWAADRAGWVTDSSYLFPILLILVGTISLLAFAFRGVALSSRRRRRDTETDDHDPLDHDESDDTEESLR